ncbi:MAG: FadR family transcriptional regulator [Anaerotruncus sp.]|nr:FadR family transcriptional regulator [Anaerotruncus sp.]
MDSSKEKTPLSARVEQQIITMIKENNMKPGDRIENEYDLARRLNVGRGTLREAIKALASRNVLLVRQGAGTFVAPMPGIPNDPLGLTFAKHDRRLALDLLEVRLILEPEIAAMAAACATEQEMKRIESQCDKAQRLIERGESYQQEDVEFHYRLAQASHNQVISTLVPIIHSSALLNIDLTRDELKEDTIRYHRELVRCVRARDAQGAKYAMILHLAENRRYLSVEP